MRSKGPREPGTRSSASPPKKASMAAAITPACTVGALVSTRAAPAPAMPSTTTRSDDEINNTRLAASPSERRVCRRSNSASAPTPSA